MSVRRSLAWMMMSQGAFFALQFGGTIVLARLLTPREMGIYAAASALIGILGILQAFGVALFLIRANVLDANVLASAFTVNALLSALLAAAIAGLSVVGGDFLHSDGVRQVMIVLAILPLVSIFEFLPATRLERDADFRPIAIVNVLKATVTTGVTVVLALLGLSYMSFAYGAVASAVAGAVAFNVLGRKHVSFRLGLNAWRTIVRFGLQQLAIQGVNTVGGKAAEFLLGRILGLDALGLYGRASNLNNLVWYNIHIVVGRVVLVDLADQHRQGCSLRLSYLRTVELITALLWPAFAGLAILAGPLIRTVYGRPWIAAAAPFSALAIAAILLVSITMTWELFAIKNETGRQARFEFFRTAVGFAMFAAACFFSLTAAAVARIGEALFSLVLYRPHVERMTETRWADFVPIYRRSALLTAAACSPAALLMAGFAWSSDTPFSFVTVSIGLGVLAWLVSLKVMNHPLMSEISRLLAKARQIAGFAT